MFNKYFLKNQFPGFFIVIEGLDGSGKTTQAEFLFRKLKNKAVLTSEPSKEGLGYLIKGFLKREIDPLALQLLFAADRAIHLKKKVIPLLKKGKIVICDRYFFSSFAYGGLNLNKKWLFEINKNFIYPDLVFFLDVSPEECLRRIKERGSKRTIFERKVKLEKVRGNYKELSKEMPNFYVIDAEKSKEIVSQEIFNILDKSKRFNF